jgi:hypothetical protein
MVSLYRSHLLLADLDFFFPPPVTYGGSILFLLFGIIYLCEAFAATADVMPMAPENGTPP